MKTEISKSLGARRLGDFVPSEKLKCSYSLSKFKKMIFIVIALTFSTILTVCTGNNEVETVSQISCTSVNQECGTNREGIPGTGPHGPYDFFIPHSHLFNKIKNLQNYIYVYIYIYPLFIVTHSLIHKLNLKLLCTSLRLSL